MNSCPPRINGVSPWRGNSDLIAAGWMVMSALCITLALMMRVGEGRHVYFLNWSAPIPETCMFAARFGIDCPGCGLTRCFVHLVHGRAYQALSLSVVGVAIFVFALLHIPIGFSQVVLRRRDWWVEAWGRWNDWFVAGLLVALLVQWAFRLTGRM